jgi:hypothetical protein
MPDTSVPATPPPTASTAWAKATLWILVVLIVALNGVIVFKSCVQEPRQLLKEAGAALTSLAEAFHRGTVTTSFQSYATTVSNRLGLQVATLRQMELFARTEEKSTAFGYVPLPDVVVEARAPVEYTYYLDLKEPWRFALRDRIVHVYAPALRFNTPAVDASGLTYEVRKGYFKTAEAQENLKRSLTGLVKLRAKDNLPLVRENARRQTVEFVKTWLAKNFPDAGDYAVEVIFADESPPGQPLLLAPPETPATR